MIDIYDGFIDKYGEFYKIKKIRENLNDGHFEWAHDYLKNVIIKCNDIEKLKKMRELIKIDPVTYLVDYEGFVYYSHDPYSKPIIQAPNPMFNGKKATKEQKNKLFEIMMNNQERISDSELLMDEKNYYLDYINRG